MENTFRNTTKVEAMSWNPTGDVPPTKDILLQLSLRK